MQDFIKEIPAFTSNEAMAFMLEDIQCCNLPFARNTYNIHGFNFEYHNLNEHQTFNSRLMDYEEKIQNIIMKYYQELDVSTFEQEFTGASALLLKGGRSVPKHTDDQFDRGIFRTIGVLLYMTSHDFGGELAFPLQKRLIKPEAGKLVIFPSLYTHPHLVMPTPGEDRYALRFNYGLKHEPIHS